MKKNPMQFDSEELQILQDFERGEFESIRDFQAEKMELEEAARTRLPATVSSTRSANR